VASRKIAALAPTEQVVQDADPQRATRSPHFIDAQGLEYPGEHGDAAGDQS